MQLEAPQPAANRLLKQMKSFTLSTGGIVLASQLALLLPAANRLLKQMKSFTLRQGAIVLRSQLG